uniref:Titin n=1 Tax=Chrysemys picta bellii TaxID=8478 RepID=A0A8C3H6N2_CHRPI
EEGKRRDTFRIIAQNDIGESEPSPASEPVVYKPSQPGEIEITSISKDSITLEWERPECDGGKDILGYWIEYRQSGDSAWKKCNKERIKDRQFTVGGLLEATEYEFRVFAENETGPKIQNVIRWTHPYTDSLLKNSVVISWKPPEDDGGALITNYVVEKCEAKEGTEWQLVSSSISSTTCRIVNLTENAGYYFRVSAQNTYGISKALEVSSIVVIKSPFEKPGQPSQPVVTAVTKDSCVVSWKPPASDGGAKIRNYYLEKREKKQNKWIAVTTEEIHETVYSVKSLVEGLEYEFRVKCENLGGESEWSEVSQSVIPKSDVLIQAPHFKEELRNLNVKFRATATFVCKVTGHPKPIVKWFRQGKEILPDGEKVKIQEFKGGYHQLVITNATDDDATVYQVRATNQGGSVSGTASLDSNSYLTFQSLEYSCCVLVKILFVLMGSFFLSATVPAKIHLPKNLEGMGAVHALRGEVVSIKIPFSATDMWSLGVLVYILLSGINPFIAETNQQTIENIISAEYNFDDEAFKDISIEAMDFIDRLLVKERKGRMTAAEALSHPWLKQRTEKISTKVIKTLRHRRYYQTLVKKEWNMVVSVARISCGGAIRSQKGVTVAKVKVASIDIGPISGQIMHAVVEEGGHAKYTCKIENYDQSTQVTWYFGIRQLENNGKYEISYQEGVATMYVKDITKSDDGTYRCKVVNDYGEDKTRESLSSYERYASAEKKITAAEEKSLEERASLKKFKTTLPATILTKPRSITVSEGETARFSCDIDGEPTPTVTWLRAGQAIVSSRRFQVTRTQYKSTFEISSVQTSDEGSYILVVENSEGRQEAPFTLTVQRARVPEKAVTSPPKVKSPELIKCLLPASLFHI